MDALDIQIFLSIVKYHSISKAADALFMSQSNISRRLMLLEKELGVQLLVRDKGKKEIVLTDHGREFVSISNQWVTLLERAAALKGKKTRTKMSIGAVHSVNFYVFPAFYQMLRKKYPMLEMGIYSHHTREIYDLIESRKLDIGIVNSGANYPGIYTKPIFGERYCLLRLGSGKEEAERLVHPEELDPVHEVVHDWSPEYQRWHDYWWKPSSPSIVNLTSPNMIPYFMTEKGDWSVVPHSVALVLATEYGFEMRELSDPPAKRICYVVTSKYRIDNGEADIRLFLQELEEFLSNTNLVNKM